MNVTSLLSESRRIIRSCNRHPESKSKRLVPNQDFRKTYISINMRHQGDPSSCGKLPENVRSYDRRVRSTTRQRGAPDASDHLLGEQRISRYLDSSV